MKGEATEEEQEGKRQQCTTRPLRSQGCCCWLFLHDCVAFFNLSSLTEVPYQYRYCSPSSRSFKTKTASYGKCVLDMYEFARDIRERHGRDHDVLNYNLKELERMIMAMQFLFIS
jgi:hypothetical protein